MGVTRSLLGERSLALALRAGCLAQAERLLTLTTRRGEERGDRLGRLLGVVVGVGRGFQEVGHPCLPFRGEGENADVFASVEQVQSAALRAVGRGVEMYVGVAGRLEGRRCWWNVWWRCEGSWRMRGTRGRW